MGELYYHDGHYHRTPHASHDHTKHEHAPNVWHAIYEFWDEVLYGIGNMYYKIRGR